MKPPAIILSLLFLLACSRESDQVCATPDPAQDSGNTLNVQEPTIFKSKCAACHMLYKDVTGPKLHRVIDRVPNEEWFDNFIRNEDSLLAIGDSHAVEIQNWSVVDGHHDFKDISDEELTELKEYFGQE